MLRISVIRNQYPLRDDTYAMKQTSEQKAYQG